MNARSPLRILLVEDDELSRLGLSTRLQREPLLELIDEAADGESALELATRSGSWLGPPGGILAPLKKSARLS